MSLSEKKIKQENRFVSLMSKQEQDCSAVSELSQKVNVIARVEQNQDN